jgi:hypothetical protein
MREGRAIDTLVGLGLAAVLVLTGLVGALTTWLFHHGAQANARTAPSLSTAAVTVIASLLAGVEGLLMRRMSLAHATCSSSLIVSTLTSVFSEG